MKKLILVGCVHAGAKAANLDWFGEYCNKAKDPNTSLLLLGDLFENAIPARGEGMMWEQDLTPDEQLEKIAAYLDPVRDKIVGCVTSNHSERSYKEAGLNLDKRLLRELGVKDSVYKGLQGVSVFAGHKIAYAHGHGSGANVWGDAKRLLQLYPEADMIALSHKHELSATWHGNFRLGSAGSKIVKYVPFVRTGSLMQYPRYAQRELYSPQKPGFTEVTFKDDGSVSINMDGVN
jgi:hypothetical protein